MRQNKWWIVLAIFLFELPAGVEAQHAKPDVKKHEQKVKDMVAFLEYVLNTLGSSGTSARDKDVLITESYTKIFRDAKVQQVSQRARPRPVRLEWNRDRAGDGDRSENVRPLTENAVVHLI